MPTDRFDSREPFSVGPEEKTRTLLIIDDYERVVKTLQRLLKNYFDHVFVATSPAFAYWVLEYLTITHVISDHDFGDTEIQGNGFLLHWRNERPAIEKAILLTGTDITKIPKYEEVDAVLSKSAPLENLIKALGIWPEVQ